MNAEEQAIEFSKNKKELLKRLRAAKKTLKEYHKQFFKTYEFDFENKCLIGANGWRLQWKIRRHPELPEDYENQQVTNGSVELVQII